MYLHLYKKEDHDCNYNLNLKSTPTKLYSQLEQELHYLTDLYVERHCIRCHAHILSSQKCIGSTWCIKLTGSTSTGCRNCLETQTRWLWQRRRSTCCRSTAESWTRSNADNGLWSWQIGCRYSSQLRCNRWVCQQGGSRCTYPPTHRLSWTCQLHSNMMSLLYEQCSTTLHVFKQIFYMLSNPIRFNLSLCRNVCWHRWPCHLTIEKWN